MNRNVESHFSINPTSVDITRSKFDRSSQHKTTFNAGELIPLFVDEVLPGDTFEIDTSFLMRMSTPIFPVMDNAYFDYYFFFVPNRLVWDHWEEFNGQNDDTYWTQQTEYTVPILYTDDSSSYCNKGSVADYMGIPTGVYLYGVNALPFRAYVKIWNDWFRDENVMPPAYFVSDDSNHDFLLRDNSTDMKDGTIVNYNSAVFGGCPLPVSKYHDYFTSCLPAPQKGEPVTISPIENYLPVQTGQPWMFSSLFPDEQGRMFVDTSKLKVYPDAYKSPGLSFYDTKTGQLNTFGWDYGGGQIVKGYNSTLCSPNLSFGEEADYDFTGLSFQPVSTAASERDFFGGPANLYVDLTAASALTVNELRQAFQVQKLLERDARGGTRYIELIKEHFGVTSPDARLQRSEYLGGARVPINVDQVIQTSSTDAVSPQGNTAAYSLTKDARSSFTQSFTEHGFIICVGAVRTEHSYQQGLERFWNRRRRFDYYWPVLANIGEQAVLKKELVAGSLDANEAFGYQEAWADYRYKPSRVSGALRSNYAQSLDVWHYSDYFGDPNDEGYESPVLNSDFISETNVNIDRTLAVQSSTEDQFIADFYFKTVCVRPMPMYSIPGLIDHN